MKSVWLYRIAAVVFLLFATGHSFGFLTFKAPTAEGRAVLESMNAVHFTVGGTSFSYGGFYRGFGLFVTLYLLFSAFLAWHLGGLVRSAPHAIGALGWVFAIVQLLSFGLSWTYFAAAPATLSGAVAICLATAMVVLPKPRYGTCGSIETSENTTVSDALAS